MGCIMLLIYVQFICCFFFWAYLSEITCIAFAVVSGKKFWVAKLKDAWMKTGNVCFLIEAFLWLVCHATSRFNIDCETDTIWQRGIVGGRKLGLSHWEHMKKVENLCICIRMHCSLYTKPVRSVCKTFSVCDLSRGDLLMCSFYLPQILI